MSLKEIKTSLFELAVQQTAAHRFYQKHDACSLSLALWSLRQFLILLDDEQVKDWIPTDRNGVSFANDEYPIQIFFRKGGDVIRLDVKSSGIRWSAFGIEVDRRDINGQSVESFCSLMKIIDKVKQFER